MYSKQDLKKLLIPLMIEQILVSLMGSVDTIMVTNVSSAAISAVSLVDSINILVIFVFSAMATGGAILCAQYLGSQQNNMAIESAKQLLFAVGLTSVVVMIPCIVFREPLLKLIFGSVEPSVMTGALSYFLITALSYPFIALYNACASIFRVSGNSKLPMNIAFASNILNIVGNALFIFGMNMGVAGAALSTLISRIICALIILVCLHQPRQELYIENYLSIRPQFKMISKILSVGIPTGIENGMFQFGKLVIQSTVSTMGTTAIAAQAMVVMLEALVSNASIGIGLGMVTVVGRCVGAKAYEDAKYYIKKLSMYAWGVLIVACLIVGLPISWITRVSGMEPAAADMTVYLIRIIFVYKCITWIPSFLPAYGLRAAGDVRFSMIVSATSMWIFRVFVVVYLVQAYHMGPLAVWIGMFADWTVRAIIFIWRFKSNKWMEKKVI